MPHTQVIHFRILPHLLLALDQLAHETYIERSEFIRQAIVEKVRKMQTPSSKEEAIETILILTDKQLEDLRDAVISERRRRRTAKANDRKKFYQ